MGVFQRGTLYAMCAFESSASSETPYEKRFQIPKEGEGWYERLKGVQDVIRTMQQECPEVLSFTVYGSVVKGTATERSDIDGTLFIDITPSEDEVLNQDILEAVQSERYVDRFKYDLEHQLGFTPEQVGNDIYIETISEQDVENAAAQYLADKERFAEELEVWRRTRRATGKTEKNLFGIEVPIYEYDGEEPRPPKFPLNIMAMFNMDIGGGIRKYRKRFLETLGTLESEQADDVCLCIATYLSFSDGGKRDGQVKLPHTYEDFKRVYL